MSYQNRTSNYPLYDTVHMANIREMVENAAKRFPNQTAFLYKKRANDAEPTRMTYLECEEAVRDLSTALISLGARDKTVALVGEAIPEWIVSFFSVMSMGAVVVPIDKELPAPDIASIIRTAECEYIIFTKGVEKKIADVLSADTKLRVLIEASDTPMEGARKFEDVVAEGHEKFAAGDNGYFDYEIDNERLASIVFTSGTTGKGKGVMLSQKNICSDMEQGIYNFQITYKTMCVLPLHHTFGSTVNIVGHFCQGAEVYLSSGLRYLMKELKDFQPTSLILVPLFVETFYKRILSTAEKSGSLNTLKRMIKISNGLRKIGIDLRRKFFAKVLDSFGGKLEMIICGGAALNQDVIDFFDGIGVTILNGYGITECAPLISCNRNFYRKKGSVGLPIIGGKVKITDPDENGEGEIAYAGPNVMLGYFRDEEATRAVIDADGYFHTGDYGKVEFDKDGNQWIYITGRLKNLIIFSNGKNVYPEEIETDIQGVYGVNEVVVYAGESKKDPSKEVIVAEIYPDFDALKMHNIEDAQKYFEDEVKKINQKNVSYKTVGKVKIRHEEFPKNTSKKITRFAIDKNIDED